MPTHEHFISAALEQLPAKQADFLCLKKLLSKRFKLPIPTNADLRDTYEKMIALGKIKRCARFEQLLKTRAVRTQSGVAVVAVLTKPSSCPGKCLYCPSEKGMPKSYLSNEPAVMRAVDAKFDPYRQVQSRLRSLELNGHATDKIELIVMGGTFSYFPKSYQKKFITECFRAANEYGSYKTCKTSKAAKLARTANEELSYQQRKNETSKHRIIGLTLETRPDYIDEKEILNFRTLGCTRVELGVQSIYDDVLELNKRGHLVNQTIRATRLLKDAGFKINFHMMPGLPGSNEERDLQMFKRLFTDEAFQPDMLKIYPTVVLRDSELYGLWKAGKYQPLTDAAFEKLVLRIKKEAIVPYVRIARLVRDVPTPSIIAGPIVSNLRQIIAPKAACPCIRCREVKNDFNAREKIVLDRIDYAASGSREIFLQYVSPDKKKLFALLRLRIPSGNLKPAQKGTDPLLYETLPVLKNAALIREVHTYGKLAKINEQDQASPQHSGLGKKLLQEAERIAQEEFGLKKIAVISGVGVRNYYRKQGYGLKQTYLLKKL